MERDAQRVQPNVPCRTFVVEASCLSRTKRGREIHFSNLSRSSLFVWRSSRDNSDLGNGKASSRSKAVFVEMTIARRCPVTSECRLLLSDPHQQAFDHQCFWLHSLKRLAYVCSGPLSVSGGWGGSVHFVGGSGDPTFSSVYSTEAPLCFLGLLHVFRQCASRSGSLFVCITGVKEVLSGIMLFFVVSLGLRQRVCRLPIECRFGLNYLLQRVPSRPRSIGPDLSFIAVSAAWCPAMLRGPADSRPRSSPLGQRLFCARSRARSRSWADSSSRRTIRLSLPPQVCTL